MNTLQPSFIVYQGSSTPNHRPMAELNLCHFRMTSSNAYLPVNSHVGPQRGRACLKVFLFVCPVWAIIVWSLASLLAVSSIAMGQAPPAVNSYSLTLNPNVYSVTAGDIFTLRGSFTVSGATPGGVAAAYDDEELFGLDPTSPHLTLVAGNITSMPIFNPDGSVSFADQIGGGGYLGPKSFTGPAVTAVSDLRTFEVPVGTPPGTYHYSYGVVFEPSSGAGFFDRSLTVIVGPAAARQNPVPTVDQPVKPASAIPGGSGFALTVNGAGFNAASVVKWNGNPLVTTFVSSAQLTAIVPSSNIASQGTASIVVTNPTPGGGTSNTMLFPVAPSRGSVAFGRTNFAGGNVPVGLVAGDLNHDGAFDFVASNFGDNTVSVFLGNGHGTFSPKQDYATGVAPGIPVVADLNGDGILDLAVPNLNCPTTAASCVSPLLNGSISILLGNGDGTFKSHVDYVAGPWTTAVVTGDINGDGKLDLIAVNGTCPGAPCGTTSSSISVLLGNGDGTFRSPVNYTVGLRPGLGSAVVGDFNGDGRLDVATANDFDSTVSILLGNGDGTFQAQKVFPIGVPPVVQGGGVRPVGMITADLNNDGKLDLAVANEVGNSVSILLGNGDGTFKPEVDYTTDHDPQELAVGDLNGDGILDLIVTNANSNTISLYMGRGDGTFQPQVEFATGGTPSGIVDADFDGDGRLDIATANEDGTVSVLLASSSLPPLCPVSLSPSSQSFGVSGGLGSFTVTAASTCSWSATPSATWVTILPSGKAGTAKVNYAVAANSGSTPRTAVISVNGQNYSIDEPGFSCSYSIGPTSASPSDLGGTFSTSVSAPVGCSWTAVSNVTWVTITSGASGSGGKVVVLNIAPNSGAARSGSATIAGQTFSINQGAGACGALDVSSQVFVTESALVPDFLSFTNFSQTITVKNTSASVIHGPVYVVLLGEPSHYPPVPSLHNSFLLGSQAVTTCFSSGGDYLLLVSGDLSPGQTTGYGLAWYKETFGAIAYSTKVLSGTPSH
jgi:hypothetical protein